MICRDELSLELGLIMPNKIALMYEKNTQKGSFFRALETTFQATFCGDSLLIFVTHLIIYFKVMRGWEGTKAI